MPPLRPSFLGCLFGAALLWTAGASAYELRRDSFGSPVRWQSKVHFVLDEGLAARIQEPGALDAVRAAVATLQAAVPQIELSVDEGPTHGVGYDSAGPNASEIVPVESWPYDADAVAVTILSVNPSTHEIVDADIALNVGHHLFHKLSDQGDPSHTYDDLQNTLTHELGHALGLAHVPTEPQAVMFPGSIRGEVSKRVLAQDDLAGLNFLYSQPAAALAAPGCSAAPGSSPQALLPVLMGLLALALRRRRIRA